MKVYLVVKTGDEKLVVVICKIRGEDENELS